MKIPATVITGFLGAGKTTLIRHLLATCDGARLALIINEFGDLGIDRELITSCGVKGCREEDIVELANGCICCTVADDFLPTIESLLDRKEPPDHIVIEASGLALPKPLVKAFNWPEVRSRVTVSGVITVIDAPAVAEGRFADHPAAVEGLRIADPALDHDQPLREVFEDQLLAADLVLLNKSDLVDAGQLEKVKAAIMETLPKGVRVVTTVKGGLDPRVALGLNLAAEGLIDGRRSHHDGEEDHDHDDFESFVVRFGRVADPARVEASVRAAARDFDVLRVKGFLDVEGKAARHVLQAVGPRVERYYDRPWKPVETRASALVVIGERGLDRAAIESLLKGQG
jgi:cobalamin biosynthesis protein CobW